MSDYIWLSGAKDPIGGIELVSEGARAIVFKRDGKLVTLPTTQVRGYRHGDTPGELDHALVRMEKGDFPAAERLLTPLAGAEGWVAAHAGFHLANARRLRAELEDKGHDEARALIDRWRARHGEHFFAPFMVTIAAEAALAAGEHGRARIEFARLAGYGDHLALASRLGVTRAKLAAGPADSTELLDALDAIEVEAVEKHDFDTVILARIERAKGLGRTGAAKDGLDLLLPLLDGPGIVRSPWHCAVLNTIADLISDLAGLAPDGSVKPEARVAAAYYINRALRYGTTQPLERARTLALAVEANTLSERPEVAVMAKSELGRRFSTSKFYARVA